MAAEVRSFRDWYELLRSLDGFHDCPFDFDLARFDEATSVWEGTFLLPLWNDPAATHHRKRIFVTESRLPVARVVLRFEDVKAVRAKDDQGIGTYSFNSAERTETGLRLRFNEVLSIDIDLEDSLSASLKREPATEPLAVYRQGLLSQSGPRLEKLNVG